MESYDPYYKLKKMQEMPKSKKVSAEPDHFRGVTKYLVEEASDASDNIGQLVPRLDNLADFIKMLLASYDFFRIPYKYLSAYVAGKPRPFKFSTLGKFVYSCIVLGLAIAMLAVHAALPLIAAKLLIATSAVTFAWSFYNLVKTIVMSGKFIEQKVLAEEELAPLLEERERIQKEAKKLEVYYTMNLRSFYNHTELAGLDEVYTNINHLYEQYEQHQANNKKIEELESKIAYLDGKLSRKGRLQVMDQSVSVALGAASILGLSLFLLMPPLSLVIIKAVLITSIAYLTVRFVIPGLFIAGRWAFNKVRSWAARPPLGPIETDSIELTVIAKTSKSKAMNEAHANVERRKQEPVNHKKPDPKPVPNPRDDEEEGDKEGVRPSL